MTDYKKAIQRLEHILDSMDAVLAEAVAKKIRGVRGDKVFDSYMANLDKVPNLLQLREYYLEKLQEKQK